MSPLRQLTLKDVRSGTVRVFAMDLSTGERQELTTRSKSYCLFFEPPFNCGSYSVKFRLDLKQCDTQGNPKLDADFYILATGKPDKSMKADAAHHTEAQTEGECTYEWNFADESRKLRVTLRWSVSRTLEVKPGLSGSARVRQRSRGDG